MRVLHHELDVLDKVKGQTKDIEVAPRVGLFDSSEESVVGGDGRLCNGSFRRSNPSMKAGIA